jgi:exosortase
VKTTCPWTKSTTTDPSLAVLSERLGVGAWWLLPALATLVAAIYAPTAPELIRIWWIDPNYSHGFLVPLMSLGFAVWAWHRHGSPLRAQVTPGAALQGLIWIGVGLALHAVASFVGNLFADVLSLIFVLRGILLGMGGGGANRAFGFSALFLIFMAPLPIGWYQPVALVLQQWVSAAAAQVLELCGAAVFREGNLIHMNGYTLEVGEACSGIRQLTSVLALALAVGHFTSDKNWYRAALAGAAIPLAVAANCLRVILVGLIFLGFGSKWAEGVAHTLQGLALVALAALLVMIVAAGLSRWENHLARITATRSH